MDDATYRDELLRSVNDTADQARTVLTATLTVAVALAAVVLSTTDEAILYDQLEVIPTVGVSVKISVLYTLMPPVFLFLHANALLKLDALADRLAALPKAAEGAGLDPVRLASLVSAFSFARLTLDSEGQGWTRRLLGTVGWLSVALVPLLLLVLTQISFVRYQSDWLSRLHALTVLADIALIGWFLARQYRRRRTQGRVWRPAAIRNAAFGTLVAAISLLAAHPPSVSLPAESVRRRAEIPMPERFFAWDTSSWESRDSDRKAFEQYFVDLFGLNRNILDGIACQHFQRGCRYLRLDRHVFARSTTIASAIDVLALSDEDRTAAKRMAIAADVSGRSLRFADFRESWFLDANLAGADLSGADLASTHLDRASLVNASMTRTTLTKALMKGVILDSAKLSGAFLSEADLRGASLLGTILHGAHLTKAKLDDTSRLNKDTELHDARLNDAELMGVSFRHVKLHRAILNSANLQGAFLDFAELHEAKLNSNTMLHGASLIETDLRGASLLGAKLPGALLRWTKLQGALLDGADLRGAELIGADLRGASFYKTKLNGALFINDTDLSGASLVRTELSGATFGSANLYGALLLNAEIFGASGTSIYGCDTTLVLGARGSGAPWSQVSYKETVSLITESPAIPDERRKTILDRLRTARGRVGHLACFDLDLSTGVWSSDYLADTDVHQTERRAVTHAEQMLDAVCGSKDAEEKFLGTALSGIARSNRRGRGIPHDLRAAAKLVRGYRLLALASKLGEPASCLTLGAVLPEEMREDIRRVGERLVEDGRDGVRTALGEWFFPIIYIMRSSDVWRGYGDALSRGLSPR